MELKKRRGGNNEKKKILIKERNTNSLFNDIMHRAPGSHPLQSGLVADGA